MRIVDAEHVCRGDPCGRCAELERLNDDRPVFFCRRLPSGNTLACSPKLGTLMRVYRACLRAKEKRP